MSESAWKSFALTGDGWLQRLGADDTELDDANMARQTFPETYVANGYVDVLSVEFIRRSRLLHGDHVLPFFTPVVTEVDTEHEIVLLERELQDAPYMQDALFE
jgi:N-acylneuraminate cytidylyltransferase